MRFEELTLEGRNAVLEAFRAKKPIDKLFVQRGLNDGPINTILREAKKTDTIIEFKDKERLDQMSQTHNHQGVIAYSAAYRAPLYLPQRNDGSHRAKRLSASAYRSWHIYRRN